MKKIKNLAIFAILTISVINATPNTQAMYSVRKSVSDGNVASDCIDIFDIFEKEIVDDVVRTRIPEEWTKDDVYA